MDTDIDQTAMAQVRTSLALEFKSLLQTCSSCRQARITPCSFKWLGQLPAPDQAACTVLSWYSLSEDVRLAHPSPQKRERV